MLLYYKKNDITEHYQMPVVVQQQDLCTFGFEYCAKHCSSLLNCVNEYTLVDIGL